MAGCVSSPETVTRGRIPSCLGDVRRATRVEVVEILMSEPTLPNVHVRSAYIYIYILSLR